MKKIRTILIMWLIALCCITRVKENVLAANINKIGRTADFIIQDSSVISYTSDDISEMTAQQLCYARNEIYARYGRAFVSPELQDYFHTKSWYNERYSPEEFQEEWLNETEKSNIKLLLAREYEICPGGYVLDQEGYRETWGNMAGIYKLADMGTDLKIDLDGNGVTEEISVHPVDSRAYNPYDEYRLCIDGAWIVGSGEYVDERIYGVSLDGVHTLLVIFEYGPSDDPVCTFYGYDQGVIRMLGTIPDNVDRIAVNEDGSMDGCMRCDLIQTDSIYASWRIGAGNMIERIPQEYYEFAFCRDYPITLSQPITVYSNMDFSAESYILQPQTVTIPYTDTVNWVYVQGETGGGWFCCGNMSWDEKRQLFQGGFEAD